MTDTELDAWNNLWLRTRSIDVLRIIGDAVEARQDARDRELKRQNRLLAEAVEAAERTLYRLTCPACDGLKRVQYPNREDLIDARPDEECGTRQVWMECPTCRGRGKVKP